MHCMLRSPIGLALARSAEPSSPHRRSYHAGRLVGNAAVLASETLIEFLLIDSCTLNFMQLPCTVAKRSLGDDTHGPAAVTAKEGEGTRRRLIPLMRA